MEIVKKLNWVDVLVIILIIRISYVAFQEGLSHEIFPIIGGIAIIVISLKYYERIGAFLSGNLFNLSIEISNFLSFLALTIATGFVFKLSRVILDKVIRVQWHPFIERFGGLVSGVMRASITASIVLMAIALAPLPYLQSSIRDKSVVGMCFLKVGPYIYEKVSRFLPTIKVEGKAIDKEELIRVLASDKSIMPKVKKEEKRRPEWEE